VITLLSGKQASTGAAPIVVSLLGSFSVSIDGESVSGLPTGSQRLLAFLALNRASISRTAIAGTMWPDVTAQRAGDSLRSALARLGSAARTGMLTESDGLALGAGVVIDYVEARALAHRLLDSDTPIFDGDLAASAAATLSRELLPGWDDDWVVIEGDEWRHLRGTALEALANRLLIAGRFAEAAGVARAAMRVDPLRETPHATLISIHLADGNQSDAIAAYDSYRTVLRLALDIEPTERLTELLRTIYADQGATGNRYARR
jgi:DNA-binding SARP family transcriptional activator